MECHGSNAGTSTPERYRLRGPRTTGQHECVAQLALETLGDRKGVILAGVTNPSKALCKCLHARLVLLCGCMYGMRARMLTHAEQLYQLAIDTSKIDDPAAMGAAARVFTLLTSLPSLPFVDFSKFYGTQGYDEGRQADCVFTGSLQLQGTIDNAVARWPARDGTDAPALPWSNPTAEHVAASRALIERATADMRSELQEMVADGSIAQMGHAPKLRLRRILLLLSSVQSCITWVGPEDRVAAGAQDGPSGHADPSVDSINIVADSATQRGFRGCAASEECLEAALLVAQQADSGNTWALSVALAMIEVRAASWSCCQFHVRHDR